ncbi:hypothetical protein D9M73_190940 [compost metagenome]
MIQIDEVADFQLLGCATAYVVLIAVITLKLNQYRFVTGFAGPRTVIQILEPIEVVGLTVSTRIAYVVASGHAGCSGGGTWSHGTHPWFMLITHFIASFLAKLNSS